MGEIEIKSDVLPKVRDRRINFWTNPVRPGMGMPGDPCQGRFKELYSFFENYDKVKFLV